MKYDVDYFINKFEKIPESKWCMVNYRKQNKRCALGHCGYTNEHNEESKALTTLFKFTLDASPVEINDAKDMVYQPSTAAISAADLGDTPKERILAALELIKAGVSI